MIIICQLTLAPFHIKIITRALQILGNRLDKNDNKNS